MRKDILEILNIKKGDIISITGSGGKTTLMYELAKKLKEKGRVLVTTSTKIKRPKKDEVDLIFDDFFSYKKPREKNIIVGLGNLIKEKNKFSEICEENLLKIKDDFDYILIEADGCRNLPLKMWKSYEPVIYNISNKTVGIFSAKTIGREIEEDFIYNFKDFRDLIDDDFLNNKVYLKLIKSSSGPFGEFKGEKFIFFNQAESVEEKEKSKELIDFLKKETNGIRYFYGSLFKEEYYEN